jgi:lipopolysaccharide/colanic/teichoic acid biosynthesis glycosyltransferase
MSATRAQRFIFLISDVITLNLSFFAIALIKTYFFSFAGAKFRDVLTLVLAGNIYLTAPWVLIFLLFGFYRQNWKLSFWNILLAVSAGIVILKGVSVIIDVVKGQGADIIPTPTGLKLILFYWCLILVTLYTSRFFTTALFDRLRRGRGAAGPTISGAGYSDKAFGISKDYALVSKSLLYTVLKRLMDFVGGLVALVLFLPTIMIVSFLIKISDPRGPVFFRQYRLTKAGRVFRIFKFRTMVRNSEAILKKNQKLYEEYLRNNYKIPVERDPRITRVGLFLRKTSLDELPQLFNVILGHMSLVGPRPIEPDNIIKYDKFAKKFLSVKPGITGWWQVAGRSNIDYPERIYLEMYYIEKASVWFDLKILVETVPTVLFAKGAY